MALSKSKSLEDTLRALAAVKADAKAKGFGRGHAGSGTIPCPACGEELLYRVAAVNGHTWGRCSKGCVSWME